MLEYLSLIFFVLLTPLLGGYLTYRRLFFQKILDDGQKNETVRSEALQSMQNKIALSTQKTTLQSKQVNTDQQSTDRLMDYLFRAGFFRKEARRIYKIFQCLLPVTTTILTISLVYQDSIVTTTGAGLAGILSGLLIPRWYLNRRIAKRDEEILYFLPLVIEQLVIGVGSGLDVGPSVQRVVSVADERDTHNPVTELLRYVQQLTRAGTPFDEALEEIGTLAGHTELKHSFMALGQVSRHGGEITKHLQELANSVSAKRETKIEARIRALELKATGPVVLVFISFMSILFIGIGLVAMNAVTQ